MNDGPVIKANSYKVFDKANQFQYLKIEKPAAFATGFFSLTLFNKYQGKVINFSLLPLSQVSKALLSQSPLCGAP